ncbi:hypothetical protein [Amycolatopsis sp. H20-H5]|uniref:hypothetical protein n=1 Tax=Amycolatopsis sp. H20-H5 TaxID=3046309 RepID=UPI002DBAE24C|nr:hypothetical protein [Amycolatopsis sp. H20-H5]MEC3974583.1 hypothetical protein [Amycolatopsis sp. H20-H5]
MSGRPEVNGGAYESGGWDAGEDFVPWTPGDAPVSDEFAGMEAHYGGASDGRARLAEAAEESKGRVEVTRRGDDAPVDKPRRWWTEDVPRRIEQGDRVTNRMSAGGSIVRTVPAGTEGRVTATRSGMFGGDFATVEFTNGYVEEVRAADLHRETGWF